MRKFFTYSFSYISLFWERLYNRLWAPFFISIIYAALALLNVPQTAGIYGHIALFIIYVCAFCSTLAYTGTPFRLPTADDLRRKVEQANHLPHRPLSTLHDKPAGAADTTAHALWQRHLSRMAGMIGNLRPHRPQSTVARQDRFYLRYIAPVILLAGITAAWGDALPRLSQGYTPHLPDVTLAQADVFDLWIEPPAYTQKPATFIVSNGVPRQADITAPVGSILKLRIPSATFRPKISLNDKVYTAEKSGNNSYTFDIPLIENATITLSTLMHTWGSWQIKILPDTPPVVDISAVTATPRAVTKITYTATDDHGIDTVTGTITPATPNSTIQPVQFSIPAHSNGSHVEDFTASPLAGQKVTVTLTATDTAGHSTTSAPQEFILPVRTFNSPLSRRLIEERRNLMRAKTKDERAAVAHAIVTIAEQPSLFRGDKNTFLALVSAFHRLRRDQNGETTESVADIIWNVAVKLDDNGMTPAQTDLRESLQELAAALRDKDISDAELGELVAALQEKMQRYVRAMAADMQQRLQNGERVVVLPPHIAEKFKSHIDIGKMLEQMRQMGHAQSRDQLRDMAENLRDMIDNIDLSNLEDLQEKQARAMEQLQQLDELIQKQQSLADLTDRTTQENETKSLSQPQTMLRRKLDNIATEIGENDDNLAAADQSMKASVDALSKGDASAAVLHQKAAIKSLQKGLDDTIAKLAEQMQNAVMSFGNTPGSTGTDPFGRSLNDDNVKLPDADGRKKVQEIIQELRRRANDPSRGKIERDYIDRLLETF